MTTPSSPAAAVRGSQERPWRVAELVRDLAVLRDASAPAERRAFAATTLADDQPAPQVAGYDVALRMFGFDVRHDDAPLWDGRSARSGTITYLDDERVEQYIGCRQWIAYPRAQLIASSISVGDQVRVVPRGSTAAVEPTGSNRLADSPSRTAREACSGLTVVRTTPIPLDQLDAFARAIAERYGGAAFSTLEGETIDFKSGAAQLRLSTAPLDAGNERAAAALLSQPAAVAVRLTIMAHANHLAAALDAECALMLCAAMLASEAETIAFDDAGAIFSADELYSLGTRNKMRADAFIFVAAAVQRIWPPQLMRFSNRTGVCDELVVFSGAPWQAECAAALLTRELGALAQAARSNKDPVVPAESELPAGDAHDGSLAPVPLATLHYETVSIDVAIWNCDRISADPHGLFDGRRDVAALLGRPIASAIVVAFGNRGADVNSACFELEMRRAETLVTALAAAFAARDDALAADARGTLYDASGLLELARRRSGKSSSWSARVAELEAARCQAEAV